MIDRLHYISQTNADISHMEAIEQVLHAGGKWIQLRVKDQAENEVLNLAKAANDLCKKFASNLIINDFPSVTKASDAHGTHVGLNDISIVNTRLLIGKDKIIGATANTFADLQNAAAAGANYIGLGPFRFTSTKKNLSPILGLEGYKKIMEQVKNANINVPIIAIGGITPEDLPALLKTGIYGLALSGVLTNKPDTDLLIKQLYQEFKNQPSIYPLTPSESC